MKKLILILVAALGLSVSVGVCAQEGGVPWDKAPDKTQDVKALQHGAALFANYCMGCHSASFMHYSDLQKLGLSEQQIKNNLMFATDKIGDMMKTNMAPAQAKAWFGVVPPDLTLIARSRAVEGHSGADYLYNYLRGFYRDETKPTGWNNTVFPGVAMPNVLWELQGERHLKHVETQQGGQKVATAQFEQITPGTVTPAKFDDDVADLVAFLQWMGDPAYETRVHLGIWVLLFLAVCIFLTWRLNKAYWKEIK
ncbi:MAG: cytochrome c1 [Burkholderiaceae bacterium]|jgi:ubiquinol-cytochrome c reductase cytochrome c1 subunit|nr:cytochrome c1 [Burkholderiaceae bacterium]